MANLLAIDQGTTSSRAIIFNESADVLGLAQQEFRQYYPRSGWVEHDPEEIWNTTLAVIGASISQAGLAPADIAAIGMTNQRETRLGEAVTSSILRSSGRTGGPRAIAKR